MPIEFYLQANPMTPDPNDQSARVVTPFSMNEQDIAQEMVNRGIYPNHATALAGIQGYQSIVAEKVADGFAINTALCTIRPGIQGVFTDVNDTFDPARHALRANFLNGPLLTERFLTASVQKNNQAAPAPVIVAFINGNTGAVNATITPGGIGMARGEQLKCGTAPGEGIFFVNLATAVATQATVVSRKTEGELTFLCPTLTAGTYRLEVRRVYGKNLTLRTGQLADPLTVA